MPARKQLSLLLLLCVCSVVAQQTTPYVLTEFPAASVFSNTKVWVKWTGETSDPVRFIPDSGTIYFGMSPGGSQPGNYPDSVAIFYVDTQKVGAQESYILQTNIAIEGTPPQRGIAFLPGDQKNMGGGVYYFIVANKAKGYVSNEMQIIVEVDAATKATSPSMGAVLTELTPTFEWEKNAGVPYYHVILSDEEIAADFDERTIEGLSIIWQAITSATQITYGAPDPSGTLTADPPPMSPGAGYSWVVLNNYGNHPAYTSKRFGLPRNFSIAGTPMQAPTNVFPRDKDTLQAAQYPKITFKWTGLDTNANTYKIYVYVAADFEGIDARIVAWESEVTAGQFEGDTASIEVDAASLFTSNFYQWRVIGVDDAGAGSVGEFSGFRYAGIPTGVMRIYTKENINAGGTTIEQEVAAAKIEVEVLEGTLEAPPLFYTDNNGKLVRSRPTGIYRVTATKSGFLSSTKTVTVAENDTITTTFYMRRPDATIFGKVVDSDGRAIDLATVIGVSDLGDTVTAESDVLGNFVLNCSAADWSVWARKTGYTTALPSDTSVVSGQSVNFGNVVLANNPHILSGVVLNENGSPIIGVNIKLYQGGIMIDEVPSTPQGGTYSFSLESGSYTIVATKTGFATRSVAIDVLSSTQKNIIMSAGAAIVQGYIYGQTWGAGGQVYAPITQATVVLIDTTSTPPESLSTISDDTYGDFQISVAAGKRYVLYASADGYIAKTRTALVPATTTESGKTYVINDTLEANAFVRGTVTTAGGDSAIGDVTVSLVNPATWDVVAQARTDAQGEYELSDVPDGVYRVQGGKEWFVIDSVLLVDAEANVLHDTAVEISDGRAVRQVNTEQRVIEALDIRVVRGDKVIAWVLKQNGANLSAASIKVRSPFLKNLRAGDSLWGVGDGQYAITIDADADSVLDLSRHLFTVPETADTFHTDTVNMPLSHSKADSMSMTGGAVTLNLVSAGVTVDTAYVFYKDATASTYDSTGYSTSSSAGGIVTYTFTFVPRKNGSTMTYYFKAFIGNDVYGYDQETYTTFVRADATTLTKMEIFPAASDTALLPAGAAVTFMFSGYYGSKFTADTMIDNAWITWTLRNASGCVLNTQRVLTTRGTSVTVYTPAGGTNGAVVSLVAKINTQYRNLAPGLSDSLVACFRASASKLDSIAVRRTSVSNRTHITTAAQDKAEFVAQGYDVAGSPVTITPEWTIQPEDVGTITTRGLFKPVPNFSGYVRVFASIGTTYGEYNGRTGKRINESGLEVHYIIPQYRDSVFNGLGCSIVLPDSMIDATKEAELMITVPLLTNRNERITGDSSIIGNAFDIEEVNGIAFNLGATDSIAIEMTIPAQYVDEAVKGTSVFTVAWWDDDSLKWTPLTNTTIASDGMSVRANITHFSRYGILYEAGGGGIGFTIRPNPFSPYVRPRAEYGVEALPGTCFEIDVKEVASKLKIEIYNVVGDKVLETSFMNPYVNERYYIWWDGKGKTGDNASLVSINPERKWLQIQGDKMCRNGRYFAVLTVTDMKNNEERQMKPLVVFK